MIIPALVVDNKSPQSFRSTYCSWYLRRPRSRRRAPCSSLCILAAAGSGCRRPPSPYQVSLCGRKKWETSFVLSDLVRYSSPRIHPPLAILLLYGPSRTAWGDYSCKSSGARRNRLQSITAPIMPPVASESGLELVLLGCSERLKEIVWGIHLCTWYSHVALEMIQIVVGPFTHHQAVEAFGFTFRILKSERMMFH